jgi:hypothetical protein
VALAERQAPSALLGCAKPRIGPPLPLRHDLAGYRETAADLDIIPMPWQENAAKYLTAKGPAGLLLYREVAAVVGRQNGKTTLTKPLIVRRLMAGRHIMHIAQVRELPRIMFEAIADALEASDPDLFPKRRGKIIWPRRGAGSESIVLTNGGSYRIAAAVGGSARGHSIDDLIIDELREMESFDVINSAKPAQRFSDDPQTIYLSNMGTDASVVLNSLRARSGEDRSLAYLEWSADPDFEPDDRRGWVQSNPAIGHYPQVLRDLETDYLAAKLGGNMAGFETEALCRSVPTMRDRLIDEQAWAACAGDVGKPSRPVLGVSMDPDRQRASVVMAWQDAQGRTCLTQLVEGTGSPIDTDALGEDLRELVGKHGIRRVAYDPLTDAELAKYLRKAEPVTGRAFAVASSTFTEQVASKRLVWADADQVTADLLWTAKKEHDETGTFQAVRAKDDRPITASLAAIRAVGLVFGPRPAPPRMY